MQDCWVLRIVHHGCGAFFPGSAARVTADINIIWPMILCGAGFGLFHHPITTPLLPPRLANVAVEPGHVRDGSSTGSE